MMVFLAVVGAVALVAGGVGTWIVWRMMGDLEALLAEPRLRGGSAV